MGPTGRILVGDLLIILLIVNFILSDLSEDY